MEYIKAWAEGKQENLNPELSHPLYHLSHPSIKKPMPYVSYTREEAEKGGKIEIENAITKQWQEERERNKDNLISTSIYPLIFIQSDENLGFAGANNLAIRYILAKNNCEDIILLNNDTVIKKDTISEIAKARKTYGNSAIYGGRIFYYSSPKFIWYDGGHFNSWLGRASHIQGKLKNDQKPVSQVNFITFSFVLIPANIINNVGLLDESYFMYVEDLDYSYRTVGNKYKLYHIPSSQLWHKIGASNGKEISEFSSYWYYRNAIKFILRRFKNIKKITALSYVILKIPFLLLKWIYNDPKIIKPMLKGYLNGFNRSN
jgi:hypothetical protein